MRPQAVLPALAGLALLAGCGVPATSALQIPTGQGGQSAQEATPVSPQSPVHKTWAKAQRVPAPYRPAPDMPSPSRGESPPNLPRGGQTPPSYTPPARPAPPAFPPPAPGGGPVRERPPRYRQPIRYEPIVTRPGYIIVPQAEVRITEGDTATSAGVTISVSPDGAASFRTPQTAGFGQLSANLTSLLLSDVESALPLQTIGIASTCAPSAQSVYVSYQGESSPDLSCTTEALGQNLLSDAAEITTALGLNVPGITSAPPAPAANG